MKRKSKLMRASGVLLVLTLITSSLVGGTFAKYVSKAEASDSARVAKWGVDVEWKDSVFGSVYKEEDSVTVEGTEAVVAPGTAAGEWTNPAAVDAGLRLAITGEPEVSGEYTTDFEITFGEGWMIKPNGDPLGEDETASEVETEFYCPLKFTFNNTTTIDGSEFDKEEALIEAIEAQVAALANGEFSAKDTLNKTFSITWEWPFENGGENQTNAKDTYLGNKAATNGPDNTPRITISATTTVSQID